jgi:AcrR family transcriptional regulator
MPTRRADATRNREKILTAAREAFAAPGGDASMAEISRRAGVGMATLYRNFPGRRELLEALYADELEALVETAPGVTFTDWLQRVLRFKTGKQHDIVLELLTHIDGTDPMFNENRDRVLAAGRPLLAAAQAAGEVRDDLALEQILDMVIAIGRIHGDSAYVEPIVRAALDGLRPATSAA